MSRPMPPVIAWGWLQASAGEGCPIAALHILCLERRPPGRHKLWPGVDAAEAGDGPVVVDAARLRQLLSPYAQMLRLVVLCACDSGNSGALGGCSAASPKPCIASASGQ